MVSKWNRTLLLLTLAACGDAPVAPVVEPSEIHAWLVAGDYLEFVTETHVLPGLVQGGRRVFLNDGASRAARTGGTADVGSIGVREFYAEDLETLIGWGVVMKTSQGWFYYETFEMGATDGHHVGSYEAPECSQCHMAASDVIRSPWPLP